MIDFSQPLTYPMRLFIALLLCLFVRCPMFGQNPAEAPSPLEKGALFTGASGYFLNSRTTLGGLNAPVTTAALSPKIQYFIQEHTALLAGVDLRSEQVRTIGMEEERRQFVAGAFFGLRQYYVIPAVSKLFIYNEIQVNASRGRATLTVAGIDSVNLETGFGGSYNLGLALAPAERLLFTVEVGSVFFRQSFFQPENGTPASRLQNREVGVRLISQGLSVGLNVRLNKP